MICAQVGEIEEEPSAVSNLPVNMRHGVNIPYLVGNTGYWWVKKLNPFDQDRIQNLVTTEDLTLIKNAGFDHIRIPIDPLCFGFTRPDYNLNLGYVTSANFTTAGQNLTKLKALISQANTVGLAVVVGLQPEFLNQTHYDRMIGWDTEHAHMTNTGWRLFTYLPLPLYNNADSLMATYLGPWKQPLCTNPNLPVDQHPLERFWDQFLNQFNALEAPPDKVYWGILDEPMPAWSMLVCEDDPGTIGAWHTWFFNRIAEWRAVQLRALKKALAKPVQWKFVASSAIGRANEFGTGATYDNPTNTGNWGTSLPTFGTAYSAGAPDNIGASGVQRVIYSPNVYAPMEYTHFDGYPAPPAVDSGQYYHRSRDFKGIGDPNPAWDATEIAMNSTQAWQSANQTMLEVGPNLYQSWIPPVYITGFGVQRRDSEGFCFFSEDGCPIWTVRSASGINWDATEGEERIRNDRLIWHYDVRNRSEENGWGWCAWEWIGSFSISGSRKFHAAVDPYDAQRTIHARPTAFRSGIHPEMYWALFEWTPRTAPPRRF